jgi:tripeptidyl-peptidase-1
VFTSSYSWDEDVVSAVDNRQACAGWMAVAARGVSVLESSGDGGVRGGHDQASQCGNNTFVPTFPSTCPYGAPLLNDDCVASLTVTIK